MPEISRQCVILAGGLGTRLGSLVESLPKPMLPVGGRPFLEHLVRFAHRFGFNSFLFLAGYRGHTVATHFASNGALAAELDARFETAIEREPMGTAGALKLALPLLESSFLLMNGDSYFDFNLLDLAARARPAGHFARVALRETRDTSRYGIIERSGERITNFRARPASEGGGFINGGVYWMNDIAGALSGNSLESDVFPRLAEEGRLLGTSYDGYFIDIGIPTDYREADSQFPIALRRPAVFFDRDMVLNEDAGYTYQPSQFRWVSGAREAIKLCNDAGYFVFVVTNQAGVARGYYDETAVRNLHAWMNEDLRSLGAHIDDFRYCPHHPEGVIPSLSKECSCRKPKPGMILHLLKTWPVIAEGSVLIGDKTSDIEAGRAADICSHQFVGGNLAEFVTSVMPTRSIGYAQ